MSDIAGLKIEIEKLKESNKKVDTNKAWEISLTRKIFLMFLIYLVVTLTLIATKNPQPFVSALIPSIGFFLSTLSVPFAKNIWKKYIYDK